LQTVENPNKEEKRERAILVAARFSSQLRREVEDFLDELTLLADTAGAHTVARFVQERKQIDPAYFIGKGKAQELADLVKKLSINLVIFDDDLSTAQNRNLENLIGVKVIDRNGLILDIFAKRAKTKEAKTQVELAQLQYLLPRLTRRWKHLSRQAGGIGTLGPGETQLEIDRRLIQKRISVLTSELEKIQKQRDTRRKARKELFKIALVGYTNTGKSTLLNILSESKIQTENRLFVTLDPTIRAIELDSHSRVLVIDTVGFIRKLPHHLVASFRSTLEEATTADLLLHVVDISNPLFVEQIISVEQVLKDLNIKDKPTIMVFNKIDLLEDSKQFSRLREKYPSSVFISAEKGFFLQELITEIKNNYRHEIVNVECILKSQIEDVVSDIGSLGIIKDTSYQDSDFVLKFQISRLNLNILENRLQKYNSILEEESVILNVELD
jgi:GTPase